MATRRRTGRPPKRVVHPILYIPEGTEDLVYDYKDMSDGYDDLEEFDDSVPEPDKEKDPDKKKDDGGGEGKPGVPRIIKVKKQTIRTNNNGNQVVDIVVVITKKTKADGYKFKVTKTDSGKSNRYKISEDGRVVEKLENEDND